MKTLRNYFWLCLWLAGLVFTISYETYTYKCKDFEVEFGTCDSGAIASGLMSGLVWPFYWVAKMRKED